MEGKFKNKYRISSTRLAHWDYGSNAPYFVTICTANREHFFGNIANGIMYVSEIGAIAQKFWMEIPVHFPFVTVDAFVVMPNHIHGIIVIDKPSVETPKLDVSTDEQSQHQGLPRLQTSAATQHWKPQTLGVIINQYKRMVTIHARAKNIHYKWQPRFHDHVIRNNKAYNTIKQYIVNNPIHWHNDTFNQD